MRKVPGGVYDKWNMSVNNNLHVSTLYTLIECLNMNTNKLNKEKRDAIIRKFY
jgi:hypothetical protein